MTKITTLKDRAMLVLLKRKMFSGTTKDKTATEIVASATNVRKGNYVKPLFSSCAAFTRLKHAYTDIYQYYYDHTLPWEDRGGRLLASEGYMEFTQGVNALKHQCQAALDTFLADYDVHVASDKHTLGSLASDDDYPTLAEMADKWGISVVLAPLPEVQDIRTLAGEEAAAELEQHLMERVEAAEVAIIENLLTPVKAMAERLSIPAGESGSVFRDTLVSNLHDTVRRMEALHGVSSRPEVAEALAKVRELAAKVPPPEQLRQGVEVRKITAAEAQKTVDELVDLFGGFNV